MAFVNRKRPAEPTTEELVEARERADAGFKLALPQLAERIGLGGEDPEPQETAGAEVDHKTAAKVARHLLHADTSIFEAAKVLPLEGHMDLHLAFNSIQNELNRLAGEIAKRWGS